MSGRNNTLEAIWKVGLMSRGRKSAEMLRMERRLQGLKTPTLCRRVTDAQEGKTLFEMSRLLVGLTKIIHQQSAQVYKESLALLSKVRREMASNTEMTINLALAKPNDVKHFTFKDGIRFVEGPHRTRTSLIDFDDSPLLLLASRGYDITALTPPPPAPLSPSPVSSMSPENLRNTVLVLDSQETEPDFMQFDLPNKEIAQAGPSRRPLDPEQEVSDYDMSNDQGWASMLAEFAGYVSNISCLQRLPHPPSLTPLCSPTNGASQEVPRNFHLAYPRDSEPMILQAQVPSPLVPRSAEESVADDFFDFAPYESSPPVSLRTDDYSHIRPYPDPSPPPFRRQRRRRIRSDGLQVVPVEDVMDDPTTIQRYAQDTRALLTYDPEAVTPRPSLKKQKERPRLEDGRDRDPYSHDSYMFPDFMDDQDDIPPPATTMNPSLNDTDDFNHISLGDDQPSSSTRRRQQREPFLEASWTGHHSDPTEERVLNYSELLEMYVQPPPLDSTVFEFDQYLGILTNREECHFDEVFTVGPGGSKRSEAALAFYYALESAGARRVLPSQDIPYGPITLHLP
ncbi:hypothetical protein [Absidia glauca]|uniref:Uncharacterized protein n=1 Tax=Absidia glauca TaxID=4829 RepID=A0A163K5S9_ABSGL|nr:hypothetical protein [Absidia glauca]